LKKWLLALGVLVALSLILNPVFSVKAEVNEGAESKIYSQNVLDFGPAEIRIANLNCKELSTLGSGISKALELEIKQNKIRRSPAIRAKGLAFEAETVGGYFRGPAGPFRKFLVWIGLIKEIKPPKNVVELSIEDKIVISALGATAADWLKGLGPAGVAGATIVKILTPLAEHLGEELATRGSLQNIGYFEVTKPGIGKMTVIYDKESKEASVIVDLEDLGEKSLQKYGWKNEKIFMYIPFNVEPPNLKIIRGAGYNCRIILKGEEIEDGIPPELVQLLTPELVFKGTENEEGWIKYKFGISNWAAYSKELFEPASDLPPCGLNKNASRTLVHIYNGEDSSHIYGFCGFSSSKDLNDIWFSLKQGEQSPGSVYVVLTDRRQDIAVQSNLVFLSSTQISEENGLQVIEHKIIDYSYPPLPAFGSGVLVKVKNNLNFAVCNIQASIRCYANDGTFLGSSTNGFWEALEPGETAKFKVIGSPGFSDYKLVDVTWEKCPERENRYAMELLEQSLGKARYTSHPMVSGVVQNNRTFALYSVSAKVRWYAEDGSFICSSSNGLGWLEGLEPGEAWRFTVTCCDHHPYYDRYEKVDSYKLKVTGTRG